MLYGEKKIIFIQQTHSVIETQLHVLEKLIIKNVTCVNIYGPINMFALSSIHKTALSSIHKNALSSIHKNAGYEHFTMLQDRQ